MTKTGDIPTAYPHIGVFGAGAWGTALAVTAAKAGRTVTLWGRDVARPEAMKSTREKKSFLSGGALPANLELTGERAKVERADAILAVVPTQSLREVLTGFATSPQCPIVLCMKGIERGSGKLVTEVLREALPNAEPALLSGPSFARDVVQGLPTAVTIAARTPIAQRLQASLGHATFRPYASEDMIGVALGGAAKNVYAIACGIVIGLGLGESARAALLARSFSELCQLGRALGARHETLMGLSGLGDLMLTATSSTSRNFSFGLALGRGRPIRDLLAPGAPLVEGVETAPALVARARSAGVDLPVAATVVDVLAGGMTPGAAVPWLMGRPYKKE